MRMKKIGIDKTIGLSFKLNYHLICAQIYEHER